MTAICVLVACLFPGDGYDAVLAKAFRLPGLRFSPGTGVPAGSALSQARRLLGEQAMRRIFELDAERSDADLGITALWKGLEVTAIDGTTMELARNDALACEFGTPADGARPLLRIVAHVRTASRRWISAEIGGYHDGENDLADKLEWSFRPGMLNLADRGFFSMDRFLRFSATGSDLAWREIRKDANLTARALAAAMGSHFTKISKIENGARSPTEQDIRSWCTACEAADQVPDLIATVRHIEAMYHEYRRQMQAGLKYLTESSVPLYEQTSLFRIYDTTVVPGLFTTAEYAAALFRFWTGFMGLADDVDAVLRGAPRPAGRPLARDTPRSAPGRRAPWRARAAAADPPDIAAGRHAGR